MADGAPDLTIASKAVRAWVRTEGEDQFIVFPRGFRVDADEVVLRRQGDSLVLEPTGPSPAPRTEAEWADFWSDIDQLRGDDRLAQPEREPPDDTV